jgi:hypothetical protein
MKYFFPIVLLFISCTTNPRIEKLTSSQRAQLNSLVVLKGDSDIPYTVIGTVDGLSCNRNKYQKQDISDEEAMQGIRIKAVKLNADAVINVYCQTNSDMDWTNNCWASVKCIGDAVKYTTK